MANESKHVDQGAAHIVRIGETWRWCEKTTLVAVGYSGENVVFEKEDGSRDEWTGPGRPSSIGTWERLVSDAPAPLADKAPDGYVECIAKCGRWCSTVRLADKSWTRATGRCNRCLRGDIEDLDRLWGPDWPPPLAAAPVTTSCTCPHGPHTSDGSCPIHVTAGIEASGFLNCDCGKCKRAANDLGTAKPVEPCTGCRKTICIGEYLSCRAVAPKHREPVGGAILAESKLPNLIDRRLPFAPMDDSWAEDVP